MTEYRDLTEAKIAYVAGSESLAAISKRLNIPRKVVEAACTREGWVQQRKAARDKLTKDTVAKVTKEKAKAIEKELLKAQKAADLLSKRLLTVLEDENAFLRESVTGEQYWDARAISDTARALKDTIFSLRNIYGLPTTQEVANMLLAEKRLEIDKRKADAAIGDTDADGGGVVEIAQVVEGDA